MKPCKRCKEPYEQYNTLQTVCVPCAIIAGRKIIKREKNIVAKAQRQELRARKDAIKTTARWASETQDIFNKMRRLEELVWFAERGIEPYCISCQQPLGNDQWCCGHFKTRKARSDLAFDRKNTYLQHNVRCNQHLSADIEGYKYGLAYRFGEEEAKSIIDYCEVHQKTPKRTPDDWKAMKKEFNAEIRRLTKHLESL